MRYLIVFVAKLQYFRQDAINNEGTEYRSQSDYETAFRDIRECERKLIQKMEALENMISALFANLFIALIPPVSTPTNEGLSASFF